MEDSFANPFSNHGTFQTNNQQLAFALATAGCLFAPQALKGPAINMYTVETLRAKKVGLGLSLEKAVQVAVDRKIPGNVSYLFTRTEELERCIKAWDLMVEELGMAEAEKRAPIVPDVPEEDIMRILCVHANNRETMRELPWFNRPLLKTDKSTTREVGDKRITEGSAKIWTLGLNTKTKRELAAK